MKYFWLIVFVCISLNVHCNGSEFVDSLTADEVIIIKKFKDEKLRKDVYMNIPNIFRNEKLDGKKLTLSDVIEMLGRPDELLKLDNATSTEIRYLINTIENDFIEFTFEHNILISVSVGRIIY